MTQTTMKNREQLTEKQRKDLARQLEKEIRNHGQEEQKWYPIKKQTDEREDADQPPPD